MNNTLLIFHVTCTDDIHLLQVVSRVLFPVVVQKLRATLFPNTYVALIIAQIIQVTLAEDTNTDCCVDLSVCNKVCPV